LPIDVVVVVGVSALDFMTRRRDEIWPSRSVPTLPDLRHAPERRGTWSSGACKASSAKWQTAARFVHDFRVTQHHHAVARGAVVDDHAAVNGQRLGRRNRHAVSVGSAGALDVEAYRAFVRS